MSQQAKKDIRAEKAHEVDIYVGMRVRQRRKGLKISQIQLAQKLGLTFQQVQKYERGSNRISASKLFETAQALSVPVGWFFDGFVREGLAAPAQPGNDVHNFMKTTKAIDLTEAFLAIPSEEQRDRVLDLIKAMAEA